MEEDERQHFLPSYKTYYYKVALDIKSIYL